MELARAIDEHIAAYDSADVERAVFDTEDAEAVASALAAFVRAELDAAIDDCVFYRSSVGAVAGLALDDGRRVVVKVHQSHVRAERLEAVQAVMKTLAAAAFPCPLPLLGPRELARGRATVEALVDRGVVRDGHEPPVRRELARRLAELVATLEPRPEHAPLGPSWFSGLPRDRLWPRPHSPLYDFDATRAGAEPIDALASSARRAPRHGDEVIAHFDWRSEHARFDGDRIVVAYDWDSLHVDLEPVAIGAAAHAFCTDWETEIAPAAPSIDEVHAFVAEYEDARGRRFEDGERRTLAGSLVYSLAYTARCTHALGARATDRARAFRELLEREGPRLLSAP
ncbi:MAG: phosphotransferase [Sandaracinaceae bacterium]|nr:phosphotransferase [Sandaracinaceae bacterium]